MERSLVSSAHTEWKLGTHQRALHHNLDPHHGKRPQAPGLEDLAQSAHSQRHRRRTLPFHALPLAPPPVGSLMDRNVAREYWMEVRMRTRVRMRAERRDVRAKYVKRRKMEAHLGSAIAQRSELNPSQSIRLQTAKT